MVPLTTLWLPILLSAVIVFIASSIVHMVLPWHRKDFRRLPDEEGARTALRGVDPGQYWLPCPEPPKDMASPEVRKKLEEGPVAMLAVLPNGPPMMPKHLIQWFVLSLGVGVFVAYLTGRAFPAGTEYITVFRYAGTIAFLGYGAMHISDPIWKGGSWGVAFRHGVDGMLFALLTAGIFSWLWP